MSPTNFRKQLNQVPEKGDGVKVSKCLNIASDLRTAAGLVLTAATAPSIAASESNGLAAVCAASTTAAGSFSFQVPEDYDEQSDYFKLVVLAASQGATNSPTLTATAYRKRAGAALTAALTVVVSAAVAGSASPTTVAAEYTVGLSANTLLAGDVITINLVTAAHTTDAVHVYGVRVEYKSTIAMNSIANRA